MQIAPKAEEQVSLFADRIKVEVYTGDGVEIEMSESQSGRITEALRNNGIAFDGPHCAITGTANYKAVHQIDLPTSADYTQVVNTIKKSLDSAGVDYYVEERRCSIG